MIVEASAPRRDGPTAAAQVADRLAHSILTSLSPGMSLPSEAELASQHGVSRLTIREAIKLLAGRGLLEVARGRKAVVREPTGAAFADFLTGVLQNDPKGIFDLVEVRTTLEVQSALLAARHASRPAIAALENALNGMREAERDIRLGSDRPVAIRRFFSLDMGFHEAVALASGNRVMIFLFEAMAGPLQETFAISQRGNELRGHNFCDTIAAHEKILQAIAQGNSRKAADAMRAHLGNTERDIRSAMSLLSDSRVGMTDQDAKSAEAS